MLAISVLFLLAQAPGIDAFREGRYHDAQLALEATLKVDPGNIAAQAFLAMTEAAEHDCSPAAAISAGPYFQMAALAAVECYSATNRSNDALALLAHLETQFPADPDVLYEAAKLHRQAWDRAVFELFQKAPQSFRINQLSAEVFETEGKYPEAVAQYQKAIEKAPQTLNLHYRLGRCYLLDAPTPENRDKARAEFEAELKLNPSDAMAEYQVALTESAPDRQLLHYQRALALRPDFVEALLAIGRAHAQQKQYADALPLFEKACALQPDNEAAHYNLMLAYRNLGRADDAMAQKKELDRLQKPPEGEFTEFLKKLGEKK